MEISLDEFRHGFEIVAHVGAERGVVEGFQLCDDAVDHGGAEDAILFIDGALGLQAKKKSIKKPGILNPY